MFPTSQQEQRADRERHMGMEYMARQSYWDVLHIFNQDKASTVYWHEASQPLSFRNTASEQ